MTDSSSNDRNWTGRRRGWSALLLVLTALVIGGTAYNAGLNQGAAETALAAAQAAPAVPGTTAPPPPYFYPYYYGHRPWGFGGFGFFSPLLFLFFWFVVLRTFMWGGPGRHWGRRGGPGARADEWHRQAHERMGSPLPAGGAPADGGTRHNERA